MKKSIESHFLGLWNRAQGSGVAGLSVSTVSAWAKDRGLDVTDAQERKVGRFRPIPAIVIEAGGAKACYPKITTISAEWQANKTYAEQVAALWKEVEWFCPLWVSREKIGQLLKAIKHLSGADAIQQFDYHLSTAYTLPFQATCIAQLLPKARSLADFAPLAREAYLAFYSGHRASSVAR